MDGRRAVTRVDGASSRDQILLASCKALETWQAWLLRGICGGIGGNLLSFLHLPTASLSLAQRNASAGLASLGSCQASPAPRGARGLRRTGKPR